MKNIIKVLLSFFIVGGLISCEKNVSKIMIEGATPPVLSAGRDTIILKYATENDQAIALNWTNPNYNLTTGPSSQNVSYLLEIDTTGANFTNPKKKTVSINKELGLSLTQKELNTILINDLELAIGKPHQVEMRIKASLSSITNAAMLLSNVLKYRITPYQDPTLLPPDLYITGDATASGWTNTPPTNQKFTYLGSKKYELTLPLVAGGGYKFLTKLGQWQPQYGSSSSNGGSLQVNDGTTSDPPGINAPGAGNYKITVDLGAMSYSIVKV